jgi:hypothetical protein
MIQIVAGRDGSIVWNTHPGSATPDADQIIWQLSDQPSSQSPSRTGQINGKTTEGAASMCWR